MLLQFACSNHKSIKDRVIFSMVASSDTENVAYLKEYKGIKVLRVASIYGANGSGKSNFVNAIGFAANLVTSSLLNQPETPLLQIPHKLNDALEPSTYEFQFVAEDIRYVYGFAIKNYQVDEEYLYYFPNNRRSKIFERIGMHIVSGAKYKTAFKLSEGALKPNRLFFTCIANYANVEEVLIAYRFFAHDLILYRASVNEPSMDYWYQYSVNLIKDKPEIKMACLELLKSFDTGIVDINAKIEDVDVSTLTKISSEVLRVLMNNFPISADSTIKDYQVKIHYEKFETDLSTEESTGIKQLFKIICPIIDILNSGKVLIYDEIETGLHEMIVHRLIELFYFLVPHKFAQLIFTTHDTTLLDMELFRRDQIWFTQLTSERATELYSLVELKNVRKNEKLSKGYISGKYGAIPLLNQSLARNISDSLEQKFNGK